MTFARDGNRFFATLRTAGINYLIEGNVDARTAKVLREGVECPSLSPDNSRIAFKSRLGPSRWRLHVLDVATLKDAPLAETRSVDDQPEWIDDQAVAYMLPASESGGGGSDIWTVSVKTGDAPRLLAAEAFSPVLDWARETDSLKGTQFVLRATKVGSKRTSRAIAESRSSSCTRYSKHDN